MCAGYEYSSTYYDEDDDEDDAKVDQAVEVRWTTTGAQVAVRNSDVPWAKLRKPSEPVVTKIGEGAWSTTKLSANVNVNYITHDRVSLTIRSQTFRAADIKQLRDFCDEVLEQIS
jgi:hypothetical protein